MSICADVFSGEFAELSDDTYPAWAPAKELVPFITISSDEQVAKYASIAPLMCLDASILGDIPARYIVHSLPDHQYPAIGVYIDRRIVPGYKYKVKVQPDPEDATSRSSYLFGGEALCLKSIGRGYSKRLTFESSANCSLNDNDNYFWADSHPGGFSLEIQVVLKGDRFMLQNNDGVFIGDLEIMNLLGSQEELSQKVTERAVSKTFKVEFTAKCNLLGKGCAITRCSGVAESVKKKDGNTAEVSSIQAVLELRQYGKVHVILVPARSGTQNLLVDGGVINDIPIQYSIHGVKQFEFPVIGSYVDPRIVPGFKYQVRSLSSNKLLFNGCPMKLSSIGRGYGKRITFESDNLNENDNYFWSDSDSNGFGFRPVSLEIGTGFQLWDNCKLFGEAELIRIHSYQKEISMNTSTKLVTKSFEVDFEMRAIDTNRNTENLRVRGIVTLEKTTSSRNATLLSITEIKCVTNNFIFSQCQHLENVQLIPT